MSGYEKLAVAIRSAAAIQNLNRSEIGRLMGLSHTTVGEWFSGDRAPSRQQLIDLEEILQVEKGSLCVLADYLPEGTNPKVERLPGEVVVRLSTIPALALVVPIIHVPVPQENPHVRRYLPQAA